MGKKMTWETARMLSPVNRCSNESIYAPPNNCGYKININHPEIRPVYEAYKRKYGIIIMSDHERIMFESRLINHLAANNPELLKK